MVARRQDWHRIVESRAWTQSAPHVKDDFANAAAHGGLGPHGVRPKSIKFAILQCFRRGHPERDAQLALATNAADVYSVAIEIGSCADQDAAQPLAHQRRR